MDNAIHRINHYRVDNVIGFPCTCPLEWLDSDLNNRSLPSRDMWPLVSFRLGRFYGFFKICNTKIIPESDSHVKVTGMLIANLESRTELDLGVAHALFDSRGDRVMHQSIPAAPSTPPGLPPGISIFFCLGWEIPWGGDSWAVKSPGVGTKKESKCPVLRQHCNTFHWSHSRRVPF